MRTAGSLNSLFPMRSEDYSELVLRNKVTNVNPCSPTQVLNHMNKSIIFVVLQFVLGFLMLVTTSFSKINLLSCLFLLSGFVIVLWAAISMRKSVIKISPDVDKQAKLIEDGPYHWIRHPMYSGALLACFGLLITKIDLIRFLIYIFLVIDLILKLNYEESLLIKHFKNYNLYKKKTFRLIPFIF
jgi:protein-S-isoprenylcysteine O-methyltransferase Ste14